MKRRYFIKGLFLSFIGIKLPIKTRAKTLSEVSFDYAQGGSFWGDEILPVIYE